MEEIELTLDTLFDIISSEEIIDYKINEEYFQKTEIKIQDEFNNWIDVNGLIIKEDDIIEIEINATNTFKCGKNHLIVLENGTLCYAKNIKNGDRLKSISDDICIVTSCIDIDEYDKVYDIEVESSTHLYQISNGTIHHNTLLTAGIVYYANELNMRTIIIVPSSSLLTQTAEYLKGVGVPAGKFGGGKREDEINLVATWQTIQNNIGMMQDFECVIWDECLHPTSKIKLHDNTEKAINNINVGDIVCTLNETTHQMENKKVIKVHKNLFKSKNQKMFKITMMNNSIIELTGNHEVYTTNGWKRTDELILSDIIVYNNIQMKFINIEPIDYVGDVYNLHIEDNHNYFANGICVKNCHLAKSFVAQKIMTAATNSYMRLGLTGTIPKDPLDRANLKAAFGNVLMNVKAKELQDRNLLSSIEINIFKLLYAKDIMYSFIDWHEESLYLQTNSMFRNFISFLVGEIKGNTLILIKNIDPAAELAELLDCEHISSKLSIPKRQEQFNKFEYGKRHIAVGTYSLLSTGIDIVHINNLILAPTSGKSYTKVIQTIGRGLRRENGKKEHVTVYDLTSNLKYDKRHVKDRKHYYKEAEYPYNEDSINLDIFDIEE